MARTKGKVAEREVAKLLCGWWSKVEPECSFVRTPSSGGWSSPQVRAEYRACADIMTTAQRFPFAVEVKRREAWSEEQLSKCRASPVWGWWAQACRQASEADLVAMLWFRRNRGPWRVLVPERWAAEHLLSHHVRIDISWFASDMAKRVLEPANHPVCYLAESLLERDPRIAL